MLVGIIKQIKMILCNTNNLLYWSLQIQTRDKKESPKTRDQVSEHWTNANGQNMCESCLTDVQL